MAFTKYQYIITILLVASGSFNTLNAKWMNGLESESSDGKIRNFQHPFFQALCMFLGEAICFIIFKIIFIMLHKRGDGSEDENLITQGNRDFNPLVFGIPAMCDLFASVLNYAGLYFTFASSYQMLRGASLVFVGILSILFFGRVMTKTAWGGIFLVIFGLTLVGIADFIAEGGDTDTHETSAIIIGDVLVVLSEMFAAVQAIFEEKFLSGLNAPPLLGVGLEGIFGFFLLLLLLVPFYYIEVPEPMGDNPRGVLEDIIDALIQIQNNVLLCTSVILMTIVLAIFNFAILTVTKELNATTRMVLDTIRTAVVWIFGLAVLGEHFHWLQLVGFIFLLIGMFVYNEITPASCLPCCQKPNDRTTG